ncbi:MAG: hypothetical protein BWK80_05320 [Desulfobacteraceae bacterium IS3]|nr:MAG: hypothetical protein BWK80_05320 [Desulfobacteraceae bacterium IS3]HAO21457.1 hypothetical protein [Desulfobacteraceae bacterium]
MTGAKRISAVCMTAFFLCVASLAYSESLVPEGLIVKEGYEHGVGTSVGTIQLVQGSVLIVHFGEIHGYAAKKDLPLFKSDTIITREDGRISFKLNDGSVLTMTTGTKLVINESVYDTDKESRSAFVSMIIGKARFWVKELADFKNSEFKVKTNTAVVGVRGSDFVVEAADTYTKVTAFEHTRIEVVSLSLPCEKTDPLKKCSVEPVTLSAYEQAIVQENALPTRAAEILPHESDLMKKEFSIAPDEKQQSLKKESAAIDLYLVPKAALVSPETSAEVHKLEASMPDVQKIKSSDRQGETARQENTVLQQQVTAAEVRQTEIIKVLTVLPGFPGKPLK